MLDQRVHLRIDQDAVSDPLFSCDPDVADVAGIAVEKQLIIEIVLC
jgi:hypothetical protein